MGRGTGRDAALNPAPAATLAAIADLLAGAREPWWVIAGAAAALHGVPGPVKDVDVLMGEGDARRLAAALDLPLTPGAADPRFRSALFLTWHGASLPVEFMAGFEVLSDDTWRSVAFASREPFLVDEAAVFAPSRAELRDLLLLFGRDKDRERAAHL